MQGFLSRKRPSELNIIFWPRRFSLPLVSLWRPTSDYRWPLILLRPIEKLCGPKWSLPWRMGIRKAHSKQQGSFDQPTCAKRRYLSRMCACGPDRVAEGVEMLAVIVPQMTLPHLVFENILGRTCLAMGYLKTDQLSQARSAVQLARTKILAHPDPHLIWRVHAIDGALNARQEKWLAATGEWRQAVDRFVDLMGEQSWRGILLSHKLRKPQGPLALLNRLPEAAFKSAKADSKNASTISMKRSGDTMASAVALFCAAPRLRCRSSTESSPICRMADFETDGCLERENGGFCCHSI